MRERYDEIGLRQLLRDAELHRRTGRRLGRGGRPGLAARVRGLDRTVYRRRRVPMDDLIALCEGLRAAVPSVLAPGELPRPTQALDEAIARLHAGTAGSPATRARRTPSCSSSTRAAER